MDKNGPPKDISLPLCGNILDHMQIILIKSKWFVGSTVSVGTTGGNTTDLFDEVEDDEFGLAVGYFWEFPAPFFFFVLS